MRSDTMESMIELSVIVPVVGRYDDVAELYGLYRKGLQDTGKPYEFIYVIDGEYPEVMNVLRRLVAEGERIKVIKLARWFGEATALTIGIQHSSGNIILTLPAYQQVEAYEIPRLVERLRDCDMVIARRWPRKDSLFNRVQSRVFHMLLDPVSEFKFHDIGCGVRVLKSLVAKEVGIYGDQHRFLPILAHKYGFRVVEVEAAQSKMDTPRRIYSPGIYLRRILDIFSIFFLVKFTKKPLRFFGILGSSVFAAGFLILLYLLYTKVFQGVALADRPILLLGTLLIVLGVQVFAIGLLGEIIIFTHAKDIKEYTIDQIIN
jgi:glycosyltransferase involved in cell wall biosynthesis